MRHLLSNIIAGFIWKKSLRDKVRTMIRFPQTREYKRYIYKTYCKSKHCKIKTTVGYGCKNFIVILGDKYVFKFPLFSDGKDIAFREKRITDVFSKISPIKIPKMEIFQYKNLFIRKYEFIHGKLLTDIPPRIVMQHNKHITKQLANFLYTIGKSNPKELLDLKPNPADVPGYLYGWAQYDIWQNFILDAKTCDIISVIDWEQTKFDSFIPFLTTDAHNWDKFGYKNLIVDLMAEYSKLYFQKGKNIDRK